MDFNHHPPSVHSNAMDFNVYAGDDDSSFTCTTPNGYFASQALRVGLLGRSTMHSLPLPFPDHKEIGREIMKERIRKEILAGEMAERRILEDEVRRELEMERIMKTRRIQMERTRFSLLAATSDTVNQGNQMTHSFFPSYPQARRGASRNFAHDAAEFTFRERSPSHLRQKKPMIAVEESILHHNSEKFLPSEQNTTSNFKLSGTKRKTRGESQLPVKKQWDCALCEVHATSENSLKAHLEGKKHMAKEAALLASKSISRKEPLLTSEKTRHPQPKKNGTLPLKGTSASGPKNKKQPPVKGASTLQTKGTSASEPKNKKKPPLKGASGSGPVKRFWCSVCKVKCNSENMLEFHRAGKKHKIFTESRKDSNSFANKNSAETGSQGFIKEVAEAGTQGFIKEVAEAGARRFVKEVVEAGAEGLTEGELGAGDLSGDRN